MTFKDGWNDAYDKLRDETNAIAMFGTRATTHDFTTDGAVDAEHGWSATYSSWSAGSLDKFEINASGIGLSLVSGAGAGIVTITRALSRVQALRQCLAPCLDMDYQFSRFIGAGAAHLSIGFYIREAGSGVARENTFCLLRHRADLGQYRFEMWSARRGAASTNFAVWANTTTHQHATIQRGIDELQGAIQRDGASTIDADPNNVAVDAPTEAYGSGVEIAIIIESWAAAGEISGQVNEMVASGLQHTQLGT